MRTHTSICERMLKLYMLSFMHAYANMGMVAHARVPNTMKDKFFCIKDCIGTNPTSSGSHSKPLFSNYKKLYMVPFQKRQKI